MIFNLFLIIYAFKQRDLMSLYDTIMFSKVSKNSRYFKKFYSSENISFLVKRIPNLQSGVIFKKTKNPFCIWTTKRVYYKNLIFLI